MRYKVPKFLERETKFFAFLTFKQLVLVGGAALILLALYYILPKSLFFICLFVIIAIIISVVFVRVEGLSLSQLIVQFFGYFVGPKSYIWRRKKITSPVKLKEKREVKEKEKEEAPLRVSSRGKLQKLSSKIEMGMR